MRLVKLTKVTDVENDSELGLGFHHQEVTVCVDRILYFYPLEPGVYPTGYEALQVNEPQTYLRFSDKQTLLVRETHEEVVARLKSL